MTSVESVAWRGDGSRGRVDGLVRVAPRGVRRWVSASDLGVGLGCGSAREVKRSSGAGVVA